MKLATTLFFISSERLPWLFFSILWWTIFCCLLFFTCPLLQAQQNHCIHKPWQGPDMVVILAGRFVMGSPASELGRNKDEGPQHVANIQQAFALMRCEVTVAEYSLFVQETAYVTDAEKSGKGCFSLNADKSDFEFQSTLNWRNPGFEQTDSHPVVCISWNDANAYAIWLSLRTGYDYRLPTEAEWEYAARATTTTIYWWGETVDDGCKYANVADHILRDNPLMKGVAKDWSFLNCSDSASFTAIVGSYAANPFGLYDVVGNVLEWVQDCWHDSYKAAPSDGSAWLVDAEGDCTRRVNLGGDWFSRPESLRSANRFGDDPDEAGDKVGFRLARTLN